MFQNNFLFRTFFPVTTFAIIDHLDLLLRTTMHIYQTTFHITKKLKFKLVLSLSLQHFPIIGPNKLVRNFTTGMCFSCVFQFTLIQLKQLNSIQSYNRNFDNKLRRISLLTWIMYMKSCFFSHALFCFLWFKTITFNSRTFIAPQHFSCGKI